LPARAPPQTPLEELTALPQISYSWISGCHSGAVLGKNIWGGLDPRAGLRFLEALGWKELWGLSSVRFVKKTSGGSPISKHRRCKDRGTAGAEGVECGEGVWGSVVSSPSSVPANAF